MKARDILPSRLGVKTETPTYRRQKVTMIVFHSLQGIVALVNQPTTQLPPPTISN